MQKPFHNIIYIFLLLVNTSFKKSVICSLFSSSLLSLVNLLCLRYHIRQQQYKNTCGVSLQIAILGNRKICWAVWHVVNDELVQGQRQIKEMEITNLKYWRGCILVDCSCPGLSKFVQAKKFWTIFSCSSVNFY